MFKILSLIDSQEKVEQNKHCIGDHTLRMLLHCLLKP